jgi:ABC-type antimicrobial peptide transport system permease subunit
MTKKHWFILAAILAVGGIGVTLVLTLALGFFLSSMRKQPPTAPAWSFIPRYIFAATAPSISPKA